MQYHFHNPGEHTVKGRRFPMEMHLVHRVGSGRLAVIGVLIEQGAHNAAFDPIWNNLPTQKGVETHYPHVNVDVDHATEQSLVIPVRGVADDAPMSEGVRLIVMTMPIRLSAGQIDSFAALIHDNYRPTQPLNGRPVLTEAISIEPR